MTFEDSALWQANARRRIDRLAESMPNDEELRDALVASMSDPVYDRALASCPPGYVVLRAGVRTPARPTDPGLVAAWAADQHNRSVESLVASAGPSVPIGYAAPGTPVARARRMDRALGLVASPEPTPGALTASWTPVEPDPATDALTASVDGTVMSWSDPELNRQRRRARLAELLGGDDR